MRVHPLSWFRFAPVRHLRLPVLCLPVLCLPAVLLGAALLTVFPTALCAQAYFAGTPPVTLGNAFPIAAAVAVDASGNVFVVYNGSVVKEIPASCIAGANNASCVLTLGGGFSDPYGVAVDGAGNVYVADTGNGAVKEIPAICIAGANNAGCVLTLGGGIVEPWGVAVDGSGNVYVSDRGMSLVNEIPASCIAGANNASCVLTLGGGFFYPRGVAVDGSGDVFVADTSNNAVQEIPASCIAGANNASCVLTLGSGFSRPFGVAVDGSGDVYVAPSDNDSDNNVVKEIPASCIAGANNASCVLTLGSGFFGPLGVAVDGSGNIYVADGNHNAVKAFQAQSVNFGSANVCPVGQTTPTPCSNTLTLTFNVAANTTIGSVSIVTTGAANLDFQAEANDTSTTLCSAQTYSSATTCTVDVTFAPLAPGERNGSVQIVDGSGNILAATDIYGTGVGPAIAYSPSAQTVLGSGFDVPFGLAVDAIGDIFVADRFNNAVKEIPASCIAGADSASCVLTLGGGFRYPWGVAVDGAGNVFVSDQLNQAVKEIPASCITGANNASCVLTLGSGFFGPAGVAVDGSGNVFVSDPSNQSVYEMLAVNGVIPANPTINTLGSGFLFPTGVAVDGSGNVFVADTSRGAVYEMLAVNGVIPANPTINQLNQLGSRFTTPHGVAVDAAENVYVADTDDSAVKEILATGGYTTIIAVGSGFDQPYGVAVDGSGNVYVGDTGNNAVTVIQRSQPPSLSFASTNVGSTSTDSPQSVQLQNIGNATLTGSGVLNDTTDFSQIFGSEIVPDCTLATLSLAPSAECNLSIDFTPQSAGPLSATLTLTDNALNANAAPQDTQTINLSGTGIALTQTITFSTVPSQASGNALNLASYASATSGLPVSFASTTPSVCTVSGTIAFFTNTGTTAANCSITASQGGSSEYAPASPVSTNIPVTPAPPLAQIIPATINFGSVPYPGGSTTQNITVTNIGGSTLTGVSATSNGSSVTIINSTCAAGVTAGNNCTLELQFAPLHSNGTHTNTITVSTNNGGSGTVKTTGYAGAVVPSATSLNFGTVSRGGTNTLPLTFTNEGIPEAVTVAYTTGSTSFSVTSNGCTTGITTNNSCTVEIEFAPVSKGTKTATIKFTPTSGPSYDITLEGTLTP